MPCSRLRSILPSRTRRSSRARVLRSSWAEISRETAVQDNQVLDGIFSMISASVLRALMRCGSLQARSLNLRNVGLRELTAFPTMVLMKSPCSEQVADWRALLGLGP